MAVHAVGPPYHKSHLVMSLEESRLHRVGQTCQLVGLVAHHRAVHQQFISRIGMRSLLAGKYFLEVEERAVAVKARVSPFAQDLQMLPESAPLGYRKRADHRHAGAVGVGERRIHHIGDSVAAYLRAAYRGESVPHAAEQQTHVVVDFCGGTNGTPRVAGVDFLFDGYGRGESVDKIHFRFLHLAEELPGVGRKALHVAALPLGI